MSEYMGLILIGIICMIIGIYNYRGHIHSLHSYHYKNVKEEDLPVFSKMIGVGMIIIAISAMISGLLNMMHVESYDRIVLIVGAVVGLLIQFWAMIKYNRGIF